MNGYKAFRDSKNEVASIPLGPVTVINGNGSWVERKGRVLLDHFWTDCFDKLSETESAALVDEANQ